MNHRLIQYLIIIFILAGIAGGYFYYQSKGSEKINSSQSSKLTSGLVGYWTMDGNDTTWTSATAGTVMDRSGNGNTGTLTSMSQSASPAFGKIGQALRFDGADDSFVAVDSDSLDNTNKLTISFWVYQTSFASWKNLIVKSVGTNNQESYNLYSGPDGKLYVRIDGNGDTFIVDEGDYFMSLNTWEHIVVVYDGTLTQAQRVKVYISGTLMGTYSETSSAIPNYASNLKLGNLVQGSMDETRIYNRALSQSEITELYNQGQEKINASQTSKLTNGLVGYWTFDGGDMNATQALDKSPITTNTGTLTGTTRAIGKVGQALSFNGTSDYVLASDSASLSITGEMSASFWMKASDVSTEKSLIEKYDAGAGQRSYRVVIKGTHCNANEINFTLSSTGSPFTGAVYCSNPVLSANQWQYITVTYIPSTSMKIYVNGVDQTRALVSGSIPASIFDSTRGLAIGAGFTNSATPNATFFGGSMDETRIYNRALSTSEITKLYNQGQEKINASQTSKLTSGLVGYWTMDGNDTTWSNPTTGTMTNRGSLGGTGTLTNMSQVTSPAIGKIGQAMDLDGSNDTIDAGNVLNFERTDSFSIAYWIYPTTASKYMAIQKMESALARGYRLVYSTYPGAYNFEFTLRNNDSCNGNELSVSTAANSFPNLNRWYHAIVTYNGSSNASGLKIYVDGVSQSLTIGCNGLNATTINAGNFYIGTASFKGKIDEARIYNRTLSASEVTELYNQGR